MGMFDWVILPFKCPSCGFEQKKPNEYEEGIWQTKATERVLKVYKKGDKVDFENRIKIKEGEMEIHNVCPKCNKYFDAMVKIKNGKLTDEITYQKKLNVEQLNKL